MENFLKNVWAKILIIIILVIILLSVGGVVGYFYYGYKYNAQLIDGKSHYEDVAKNVKIICYFGSKETISGQDSGMTFSKNDFDANGIFINYNRNGMLQDVCGITQTEINTIIEKVGQGGTAPKLLSVVLTK